MCDKIKHSIPDMIYTCIRCRFMADRTKERALSMAVSVERIRKKLADYTPTAAIPDQRTPTAVALLLRMGEEGAEVLFIERAAHERDPWSGNIGFPGGKLETGDRGLRETAEREVKEELGIDLDKGEFLGQLTDIIGAHLPVRVSCFVYALPTLSVFTLSSEIRDSFWVPIARLCDPARHVTAPVIFGGKALDTPAIILPEPEKPVLWGITYRLIIQFMQIVSPCDGKSADKGEKP